jgi:hypothetical protein
MIASQDGTKKVSLDTELRNAAAKLRKHVKHATDGPWVTSTVWSPRATSTSAVYSHAHPTGTDYLLDIARHINGEEAAS